MENRNEGIDSALQSEISKARTRWDQNSKNQKKVQTQGG